MGGCAALQPIPSGRYAGPKNDNAVNLRLSAQGINYLNRNWQTLIETFAPGRVLTLPVGCTQQQFSLSVLGNTDVYIADQGNASGQGRNDARCDNRDLPAQVSATITGFSLLPRPTDALAASVSLRIDTGKLYVTIDSLCNLNCSVRFDSSRQMPNINTIDATVRFSIDQKWDKLLAFEITQIDGTQICGSSGAPAAPRCIAPDDLSLDSEGGICSFTCDVLDIGAVKNFVLGLFSPTLQTQIRNILGTQRCQACGMGQPPCPTVGTATSVCQDSICKHEVRAPLPRPRGARQPGRDARQLRRPARLAARSVVRGGVERVGGHGRLVRNARGREGGVGGAVRGAAGRAPDRGGGRAHLRRRGAHPHAPRRRHHPRVPRGPGVLVAVPEPHLP
jgi:hypothetical protein